MKPAGFAVILGVLCGAAFVQAADATTPVDYTRRNAPFTPGSNVTPEKKNPVENPSAVQDKRVDLKTVDRKTSPLGERRAAIEMGESREKNVHEKNSRRPEKSEQQVSAHNHKLSSISTANDTSKPPTVAKYQDSLSAASASNMARFPALDQSATAKINRFVFRKNPGEPETITGAARVVPAGGAAAVGK